MSHGDIFAVASLGLALLITAATGVITKHRRRGEANAREAELEAIRKEYQAKYGFAYDPGIDPKQAEADAARAKAIAKRHAELR